MIEKLYSIFLKHPIVCTDTRDIKPGSIFFALKGGNFNGNKFAEKAIEMGCAYAVIDEKFPLGEGGRGIEGKLLLVDDVLKALQQLANHHRKQLTIPVIGITGSNGKTTSKELINAVLSKKYKVLATVGNLNNHIGVPLTLLNITKQHEMAIIEMGANHQGEIAELCEIAEPDFGIITNIGKAHLEGFGGIEGVKKGKSELYKYIQSKQGKLFVHGDDEVLLELSASNEKVTYGTKKLYDIVGAISESTNEFISFQWATRYNAVDIKKSELVSTQLVGIYNYYNLLCAACVGNYFKVDDASINQALKEYTPSNNRSQLHKTKSNKLILDYYNANPSSMSLAIENFSNLNHPNKMVILGDMLELGSESKKEHDAIVALLQQKNISNVLLVGPLFMDSVKNTNTNAFSTSDEAVEFLKQNKISDSTILIKGSRGIKLEKVVEVL
ncbi:MAG TPA: UDP-N-acetylmuramoyl-tripeptide--D-alanyl-D-alanine ligase [Bacteroidia bacterium]|nr:UDP-N-acetylmuramoyl-tripeptide--D-alanyl-D-alanine ligase [Bacteroidia bacterium]